MSIVDALFSDQSIWPWAGWRCSRQDSECSAHFSTARPLALLRECLPRPKLHSACGGCLRSRRRRSRPASTRALIMQHLNMREEMEVELQDREAERLHLLQLLKYKARLFILKNLSTWESSPNAGADLAAGVVCYRAPSSSALLCQGMQAVTRRIRS